MSWLIQEELWEQSQPCSKSWKLELTCGSEAVHLQMRAQTGKAQTGGWTRWRVQNGVSLRITELSLRRWETFHRWHGQHEADNCHGCRTLYITGPWQLCPGGSQPSWLASHSLFCLYTHQNILLPLLHPNDNPATYSICGSLHWCSLKGPWSQNKHVCGI